VRDMDDDTAIILMVDSNCQREHILPSEKAKAYQMKLEAIKRQGQRRDLTSGQVVQKLSVQEVADAVDGENLHRKRASR
jgi:parB-like partition proteins